MLRFFQIDQRPSWGHFNQVLPKWKNDTLLNKLEFSGLVFFNFQTASLKSLLGGKVFQRVYGENDCPWWKGKVFTDWKIDYWFF